jgi:hypothetical protein
MFAVVVIAMLLVLLAPSWIALLLFRSATPGQAVRRGWRVWVVQVIAAAMLIYLANAIGLLNPAGYTLGICASIGMVGALFLCCRDRSNEL